MKTIFYWGIMLLLLAGCQKEEVSPYADALGGLQFDYKSMTRSYNFSFVRNEEGKYLGDSLRSDTIRVALSLVGYVADRDREVVLDTTMIKGQSDTAIAQVTFLPPYVFRANRLKDTIKMVLYRPEKRGKYTIGITFDWDAMTGSFEKGTKERLVYRIDITDNYPQPEEWAEKYLGEYTEEKYAFYVTVTGEIYKSLDKKDGPRYNKLLRQALEEYNREHPDEPKDFDFPKI